MEATSNIADWTQRPNEGWLVLFTIYRRPMAVPQRTFVIRRWFVSRDCRVIADAKDHAGETLDDVRKHVPALCSLVHKDPADAPEVVETWIL